MEGMIGEIIMFAGNFAPKNWAYCQGQTIQIASNTALFSILGTTYGGNGTTNFKLPDTSGRVVVGAGHGPGLSSYTLGQASGTESVTLTINNMPAHTHILQGSAQIHASAGAGANTAAGNFWGTGEVGNYGDKTDVVMAGDAVTISGTLNPTGSNVPFTNMQPYLGMNFVICMYGIYPSRN